MKDKIRELENNNKQLQTQQQILQSKLFQDISSK